MIVTMEYIPPGPEDHYDALLITGKHLDMEEMSKLMRVMEGLGLLVNHWHMDMYNGLSNDLETKQRHFFSWTEYFRGKLIIFPVEDKEMLELFDAEDMLNHVLLRFLGSGIVLIGADSNHVKSYLMDRFSKMENADDKDIKKQLSDAKIFNLPGNGCKYLSEDIFVDLQTTEFTVQARMLNLIVTILSALSIERKLQIVTRGCFAIQQNWRVTSSEQDLTLTNLIAFALYKEIAFQTKRCLPLTRMQNLVHLLSTDTESYTTIDVVKVVSEAMYRVKKETFKTQWNMLSSRYKSVQMNVVLRNEVKKVLRGSIFDNKLGKDQVNAAIKSLKSASKKPSPLLEIKFEQPLDTNKQTTEE
jgi:hypothetical protein